MGRLHGVTLMLGLSLVALVALACGGLAAHDGPSVTNTGGTSSATASVTATATATTPTPSDCKKPPLGLPWPAVPICDSASSQRDVSFALLCPFERQLNIAHYGAFTGCCPPSKPYACANSTPWQCFRTAAEALASCGSDCVVCSAP